MDFSIFLFFLTFDQVDFCELELRETHENDRRQTDEEQLERPKTQMRDWRESVEANILTTGLVCIASEIPLKRDFSKF